jgi:hypothetical protein
MTLPGGGFKAGDAYIEFHANADQVPKDLEDSLRRQKAATDRLSQRAGQDVGAAMARGLSDEVESPRSGGRLRSALDNLFKRNRKKLKSDDIIDIGSGLTFEREADTLVGRFFSSFTRLFRRRATATSGATGIGGVISNMFTNAIGGAGNIVSSIGSSVGNVGANGPLAGGAGLLVLLGIPALIGAAGSLLTILAPLLNVIYLLPGAIFVLIGAIVPLITVFSGLSTAIAAVMSNDPQRIADAFKNMGPAAQNAVKQLANVIPFLKEWKQEFQNAFFIPIANSNSITRLFDSIGTGPIYNGFLRVAGAAGEFVNNFLLLAENPAVAKFLDDLFLVSSHLFTDTSFGFNSFLIGLAKLADKSMPFIDLLITKLGNFLERFGNWLGNISQDDFNKLMDKLSTALDKLKELSGSGWNLLMAIFGESGNQDKAQEFFDNLVYTLDRLTDFFKSDVGQQSLRGMITLAEIFVFTIGLITTGWALVGFAVQAVGAFIEFLGQQVIGLLKLIGLIPSALKGSVVPNVTNLAAQVGAGVAHKVTTPRAFAEGGVLYSPEVVQVAEGGPEVIIPLNDPNRAAQLANQSGLAAMLNAAGSAQNAITVQVFIGQKELDDIIDSRVTKKLQLVGQNLAFGTRGL